MAIRLIDQYPNRAGVPNADYPHGVPRNKSTPTSTDGTPFEQAWFRDQEGFFQGLLETAGITPSGSPDTVEQSDYFDALVSAMHGVTEVDVGGVGDVTLGIYPSRVAALRLTGVLGADVDLIVPDTERLYTIINETSGGFIVTVRTPIGSGVAISDGVSVVRSDGADIVLSEPGAVNISYDNTASGIAATDVQAAIDDVEARVQQATENTLGTVEFATDIEARSGEDDLRAITPAKLRAGLNAEGSAPIFACRAWVNFDGTTTPPTIRASGNVSSVVRNSTGNYTINFIDDMPYTGFCILSNHSTVTSSGGAFPQAASDVSFANVITQAGGSNSDQPNVFVSAHA